MKKELVFISDAIIRNPQFLKIAGRVAWRNATSQIDYHYSNGRSRPPKSITFKLTSLCNMNCKMCNYLNAGYFDHGEMLPVNVYKNVLDEVYHQNPLIVLTGGETLLHPDLTEILWYAKEYELCSSLTTNGWFLAEHTVDIVNSGLDLLVVSIDGPEQVHDGIRGKDGAYRRAMEGIGEVMRYEDRPLIFINAIIQADSYAHFDQLVDEAEVAGVDGMNIQVLWTRPPDRAALHNQLFPEFCVGDGWIDESLIDIDFDVLDSVLGRVKKNRLYVSIYPAFSTHEMCDWYTDPMKFVNNRSLKCPWMWAIVFQDGTIRMCDDIVLGSLHDNSFWEIWNGDRMVAFRETLNEHKSFPICAGCCFLFRQHTI